MATESAPEGASTPAAVSVEDKLDNLFGGSQPVPEGDEFSPSDEPDAEPGDDAEAGEPAEESAETSASEALEDVEFDGRTWQVPKDLKPAIMHTADYTRKTQDLADERKGVEAQRGMLETQAAWLQQSSKGQAMLESLDAQLGQYKGLDWANMDTDQITRTKLQVDQLKERRSEIAQALQGAYQQFQGKLQEGRAALLKSSEEYLSRNIPKWNKEMAKTLSDYATAQGFTEPEMNAFDNPKLIKMAWKAQRYDQLQATKSASIKRAEGAMPVLKPGAANPLNVAKAERMNFKKALGSAKDSREKANLIRGRLEKMFS